MCVTSVRTPNSPPAPRQSDSCACPGSVAWPGSVAHFGEGTALVSPGSGLAGPVLAAAIRTEPVPHRVSAGSDGAWTGSLIRVARCCAWQGRGLGLCCPAWGTPHMFWEAPKGGCGERCFPSSSAPTLLPHTRMLVISLVSTGGKLRHTPPPSHSTVGVVNSKGCVVREVGVLPFGLCSSLGWHPFPPGQPSWPCPATLMALELGRTEHPRPAAALAPAPAVLALSHRHGDASFSFS